MSSKTTLVEVTKQLGIHYKEWKTGEKDKEKFRPKFFELVTAEVDESELAQKTVKPPEGMDPAEYVETYFPGWRLLVQAKGTDQIIIQEDPEFKTVSFVNPEDGMVYTRQVDRGSPELDDERLRAEDPDLWEEITYVPEPERELRDLDSLDEETQAKVQRYLHFGKPKVKLAQPRKATDEEL